MFSVGDMVVHNDYGVCKIIGISTRHFPGQDQQDYYEIVPLLNDEHGTTFYVSVENGEKLRAPMNRGQILAMIDAMPDTEPLTLTSSGNRVTDMENAKSTYNALMKSGKPQDWVLLLRTIYRKGQQLSKQKKRLSEFESYARENSERLLYGEIAGVLDIPLNSVERFITSRIEDK